MSPLRGFSLTIMSVLRNVRGKVYKSPREARRGVLSEVSL